MWVFVAEAEAKKGRASCEFVCLRLEHLADEVLPFFPNFCTLTPRSFTLTPTRTTEFWVVACD